MKVSALWAAFVYAAVPALAYFPPIDARDGLSLRVVGFDESAGSPPQYASRPATEVFEFSVELANGTDVATAGALSLWLNDDWEVGDTDGAPAEGGVLTRRCAVAARSANSFAAVAMPKPGRVLPAIYPIHAKYEADAGEGSGGAALHPIALFMAAGGEPAFSAGGTPAPAEAEASTSVVRLAAMDGATWTQVGGAEPVPLAEGDTGARFESGWQVVEGEARFGFFCHPPWKTGAGAVWRDIPVALPAAAPLELRFSASLYPKLKDSDAKSDGTEHKAFVVAPGEDPVEVASVLSTKPGWIDATADLSPWSGKSVTLRLWVGPGPAGNTTCDRCSWGDVGIVAGVPDANRSGAAAANLAAAAAESTSGESFEFPLSVRGEEWTASFEPGAAGAFDGTLSFSDGTRAVSFRGFSCAIDDIAVGPGPLDARCVSFDVSTGDGGAAVTHRVALGDGREVEARVRVFADGPALRLAWDMPGAVRDKRGSPRFTRLGPGPASEPASRAYLSMGNVLEEPRAFSVGPGNFRNFTRHVGADYPGGASLCQAVDVFPDRVVCNRAANLFAAETRGDATISLVPSARGAFAAARAWRDVSGYRPSPSWREAATRLCLDQWAGDYRKAAAALRKAAKYGLGDSVFVKHGWQRWGFDYRLPEIWPAWGDVAAFLEMAAAAKESGILFAPHDNYIDYYPDAAGFSYDDILFNHDGTPQKAWLNRRKNAQSYRWAPDSFLPSLLANAAALRDAFAPDAVFIDVFSALAPMEWFDRAGRFHEKTETAEAWGRAFDEYRRELGSPFGVAISESGTDALVGHLDAGQADHFTAAAWMPRGEFADSERVPWHDIATHGSFVLYGGGLGWRYDSDSAAHGAVDAPHGWGSDDYLCTTVIGGRSPLCDGPFSRRAVLTHWLAKGVCDALALSSFEGLSFGGSIHRQRADFGDGGAVWVNRGSEVWRPECGYALPQYGFYAETPEARAGVVEAPDGRRCAFSAAPGRVFVDSRAKSGDAPVDFAFAGIGIATDGALRLTREEGGDLLLTPLPGSAPFAATLDLAGRGAALAGGSPATLPCAVAAVEAVEPEPGAAAPQWDRAGAALRLRCDARAFAYRVRIGAAQ